MLPPNLATLVLRGHLAVFQPYPDGRREMIALAPPGSFLGALTVAHGSTSTDLVGMEEGLVARWRPTALRAAAARDPALGTWLMDQALASTKHLYERVERNATKHVTERLAEVLWRNRAVLFSRPRPLLSRDQLAELVAATREMTMRAMRDLERERIIRRVPPSGLELLDPSALRRTCGCQDGEVDEPRPLGRRGG
ncbi:MAG: Crp/Fnr family transcriptional regulator [Chloroflexi bacterium]|nr:Crp/Fnr family transcriptional regulator [Chloroflexota bacterium]